MEDSAISLDAREIDERGGRDVEAEERGEFVKRLVQNSSCTIDKPGLALVDVDHMPVIRTEHTKTALEQYTEGECSMQTVKRRSEVDI